MKPCLWVSFSGSFSLLLVAWAHIPVNTVQRLDFIITTILLEVGVEVVLPHFCGDALTHVSGDVVLDIG